MLVPKLQLQLTNAKKKEGDQGEQVKKLRDKVAALHRTQMSLDEEISELREAKHALELERRRVVVVRAREDEEAEKKARDDEQLANAKLMEELNGTNTSLKEALDATREEITRINELLHERDQEINDLQAQLQTHDAEREAALVQQQAEVIKSAQESKEREQFLELSLNRSMQDAYLVQGVQVHAHSSLPFALVP